MRVTINHREESAGITGSTKHHFVDCAVEFGEEEKAIIKARDLYNHNFTVGAATPIASGAAFVGSGATNILGRLMVLGGVVLFFISPFIGEMPYGPIGFFGAVAGGIIWAGAAFKMHKQDKRVSDPDQVITLKNLLNHQRFTIYASSPADGQSVEEQIRGALAATKLLITTSTDLKPKQTFEL